MGRTFPEYVTEQISEALYRSGQSIPQAAATVGINHMTLRRSLDGGRAFSLDEIAIIAQALGLTPAELMNAQGFTPV